MSFVDPGIGEKSAPVGTESWAKRWRLSLQSAVKNTNFDVERVVEMITLGQQHRAWTLLQRKDGSKFRDWDDFVAHEYPWGLNQDPSRVRTILESAKGKQAVQLETVSEPQQGKRVHTTSPNDCAKSRNAQSNLRAINRAPEIVGELYRNGLINQVEAAKLGKKDTDKGEVAAELSRVLEESKELAEKEKRKRINEAARAIAGIQRKTASELAIENFRKTDKRLETLRTIVTELEAYEVEVLKQMLEDHHAITN